MATALQFGKQRKKSVEIEIDPDLKGFIDSVVVPILVKAYMEILEAENFLAKKDSDAAHSVSSTAAPAPGKRDVRP